MVISVAVITNQLSLRLFQPAGVPELPVIHLVAVEHSTVNVLGDRLRTSYR